MGKRQNKLILLKGILAACLLFNHLGGYATIVSAMLPDNSSAELDLSSQAQRDDQENSLDNNQATLDPSQESDSNDKTMNFEENDPEVDVEEETSGQDQEESTIEVNNNVDKQLEEDNVVQPDEDSNDVSVEGTELIEGSIEEISLFAEERATGTGLVQLWQVVPEGQTQEGKTTSEIMKALQCRPNHNLYPLNGSTQHGTYVNSCYVDDALYLGEDTNYYHIYLSGYEGKVPKSQTHTFSLDLNGDGKYVDYKIETVAYYVPAGSTAKSSVEEAQTNLNVPELNYSDQYLDKYNDSNAKSIELYSTATVQSPSYYANENGTLFHYLTSNVKVAGNYSKVTVGKAPSWMSSGVKYYSYDGVYFYTNWQNIRVDGTGAVNQSNPFYNYYQYLPIRSKSNYISNTFDTYTNANGGAAGKLVNTGQYFYAVQDKYGINGALQYAMGIHESEWGKSSLSIKKNNLFGMNATDNNPYGNGTSFPSIEAGINYHADRYLSWGYTDPIDDYRYFGSHVGNKGSGMNVKYASDPFWGEKIAGWYYRFDSASGLKDYNYYTIGIKTSDIIVDIKSSANTSSSTLYQTKNKKSNYKIKNYPVLIIGESNGFYAIKTDTPILNNKPSFSSQYTWSSTNGYISKSNISAFTGDSSKSFNNPGKISNLSYIGHLDTPTEDSNVKETIMISGWYLYGGAIERIEVYVDGVKQGNATRYTRSDVQNTYPQYNANQAAYQYSMDTTKFINGKHELKIVAVGMDGTTNEIKQQITIKNLYYIGVIDNPGVDCTVRGITTVNGWYLYGGAIERIEVYVDGVKQGNATRYTRPDVQNAYPQYNTNQAAYQYELDTSKFTNGNHELKIVAVGADGTTNELKRNIVVDNLPYLGVIDNPVVNGTVRGTTTVNGWYLYGGAIERIEVYVDGMKQGNATRYTRSDVQNAYPQYNANQAAYQYELDTSKFTNGNHELKIVAVGANGTTNELKRNIVVDNFPYLGVIDNPVVNGTVRGTTTVNGWYLYGGAIERIEVYIDGVKQGNATRYTRPDVQNAYPQYNANQAAYQYELDTSKFTNGNHELKIVAVGANGTTNELKRNIVVDNFPYLGVIDNPVVNGTVRGTTTVNGWYLYGGAIERIEVYVDGVKQGNATRYTRPDVQNAYPQYNANQAAYQYELDTSKFTNGNHELKIVAVGANGTTNELKRNIVVDNLPYLGVIDNPVVNGTVRGTTTVNGWYLYGGAIERIEVYVDGMKQGNATRYTRSDVQNAYPKYNATDAAYQYTLDTTKFTNGNHELKVVAIGANGTKNELAQTIIINN